MRLIDTQALELCDFDDTIPKYAILSHRWGHDEVTFQEMQHLGDKTALKTGFKKIRKFCRVALSRGCLYAWVDTCCIDKTDPTELAEAINSMFRWYQNSDICIVYLSDVFSTEDPEVHNAQFETSQWFSRGWTLQELLAPAQVDFYSADWHFLSTKKSCLEVLVRATGVVAPALSGRNLRHHSVAERMSWAAKRRTTRVEDMAYCLLGIFDVSIPLLYGEGHKAFIRLQEEIIRSSSDQSIFAWTADKALGSRSWSSALAPAPDYFKEASRIERSNVESSVNHFPFERKPFSVTNLGINITLPIVHVPSSASMRNSNLFTSKPEWWAVLDCYHFRLPLCIPLQRVGKGVSRYQRVMRPNKTIDELSGWACEIRTIYIHLSDLSEPVNFRSATFISGRWSTDVLEKSRIVNDLGADTLDPRDSISFSRPAYDDWIVLALCLNVSSLCHTFVRYMGKEGLLPVLNTFAILSGFCLTGSIALQVKLFVLGGLSAAGFTLETISTITTNLWRRDWVERTADDWLSTKPSAFYVKCYRVHRHDEVLRLYWTKELGPQPVIVFMSGVVWYKSKYTDALWVRHIGALIGCGMSLYSAYVYVPRICKPFKQRQWPAAVRGSFWLASMFYVWYMVLIRHPS